MPIRPENKDRYPKDWPEISRRVRDAAGNECEWCGVPNGQLGGRSSSGAWYPALPLGETSKGLEWPEEGSLAPCVRNTDTECGRMMIPIRLRIVKIVLTVAHLDHRPENCARENLKALCQRCHNLYDAPMRRAGIMERARKALGMGDLFGGIKT